MLGTILSFVGPLIGEGISLVGQYLAASKEEQAKLIAARDAAIATMKGARAAEEAGHAARIEAAKAAFKDDPTQP
jgi:hypothetical protein